MKTSTHRNRFTLVLLALGMSVAARAAELSTFDLIKEGDRYVGEQAKDRVVQVRSDKSVASLFPAVWYVVYYDPTATLKATEVKFGGGKMMEVKRPMRLLEPVTGGDLPLDMSKVKVDADAALQAAQKDPLLANLHISSTQFKLDRAGEGVLGRSGGEPVWKIKLWASKVRNPSKEANIGEVWISALDGKEVKSDLHINSAG
ncbi:conserved exported hypothetical protein [Verrucomicrobia bacterium]|nr:conserved exported hypothetical protein [Verrucomicrobiota bacterium]